MDLVICCKCQPKSAIPNAQFKFVLCLHVLSYQAAKCSQMSKRCPARANFRLEPVWAPRSNGREICIAKLMPWIPFRYPRYPEACQSSHTLAQTGPTVQTFAKPLNQELPYFRANPTRAPIFWRILAKGSHTLAKKSIERVKIFTLYPPTHYVRRR